MSLKSILQEGMKERNRKKSLGKIRSELQENEKAHAGHLVALGQKAWEVKADISVYADLKAALSAAQKTLADLKAGAEQLHKQKQESAARKKQENDRCNASVKEVEEKKQGVDKRLSEQKNILQANQKETQRANIRLTAIAGERARLENKKSGPEATATEKAEIARGLDLLLKEETGLKAGSSGREEAGKPLLILMDSLQQEAGQLQKQLDGLRNEQKKNLAEIDREISALNGELAKNGEKTREKENGQKLDFQRLGEKLADAGNDNPALAGELAAVIKVRSEMERVRALINGLESQKDATQVSAYKKMLAIITGAVILIAAAVIVLIMLLAPKKQVTPLGALFQGEEKAVESVAGLAQQMQKGLSGIKDESEKIQGHKIVAASEKSMRSTLPDVSGWQLQNPEYSQNTFQDIETSSLQAAYAAGDGRTVRVEITDAGTASALLLPLKMAFATNLRSNDEHMSQTVSTVKGTPVLERFDKDDKESTIGIIYRDRYLVELKTESEPGLELLRQFVAELNLSRLP